MPLPALFQELKKQVGKNNMDPIADFLIRIKNAYLAKRKTFVVPHSKTKEAIAKLLVTHTFIKKFSVKEEDDRKNIFVELLYRNNKPALQDLKRVSKPGRRIYTTVDALPWGKTPNTLFIISTSQGLMSQRQAKVKNAGGEIMAQLW